MSISDVFLIEAEDDGKPPFRVIQGGRKDGDPPNVPGNEPAPEEMLYWNNLMKEVETVLYRLNREVYSARNDERVTEDKLRDTAILVREILTKLEFEVKIILDD